MYIIIIYYYIIYYYYYYLQIFDEMLIRAGMTVRTVAMLGTKDTFAIFACYGQVVQTFTAL